MNWMQAAIEGSPGSALPRRSRAAGLLATASLLGLLCQAPRAAAQDCAAAGAPPSDIATPATLYETLRDRTDAQLLAISFLRKPLAETCAWIYEVKMLTASGAVVELDFSARDLDLIGARGPDDDHEVTKLLRGLGGDASALITGSADDARQQSGRSGSGSSGSGGEGGEGGNSGSGGDGGDGGEGGNSGSGSGNSGSGGGGDDGGGEGGSSGSGSDGGGEGGDE